MKNRKLSAALLFALALAACDSKPKVIEADNADAPANAPIFQDPHQGHNHPAAPPADATAAEHKVTVAEVLHTEKYSYLRVSENGAETWIAISRRDVKVGSTAYYRGGLMKKNFQSKEFNRVFDTVWLIGDFREEGTAPPAGMAGGGIPAAKEALEAPKNLKPAPGAVRLADLIKNIQKYDGKAVKVTGKVVKMNPMIMGRNWLHLQDGSGKDIDLTVTTTEMVELGSIVTLEGTIALNKDFGAGYRYDYIMEAAVLK
jgi:GW (Gly-Tryp) dipeptide domain